MTRAYIWVCAREKSEREEAQKTNDAQNDTLKVDAVDLNAAAKNADRPWFSNDIIEYLFKLTGVTS